MKQKPNFDRIMKPAFIMYALATLLWILSLLMVCGCTTFHVRQVDESPDERTITTEISATAWFSSAQAIAKIKALQTDKTQSFGSESIGQHGSTNLVATLEALARLLEAARPTP